jgi:hypothetical protein
VSYVRPGPPTGRYGRNRMWRLFHLDETSPKSRGEDLSTAWWLAVRRRGALQGGCPGSGRPTGRPVRVWSVPLHNGGGPTKAPKRTRIARPGRRSRIDRSGEGVAETRDDTEDDVGTEAAGKCDDATTCGELTSNGLYAPRRRESGPNGYRFTCSKPTYPTVQAGKRRGCRSGIPL